MGKLDLAARKEQAGFTLVELAVVMIIIGLLIGGVLKGQELIANAQITSTASSIKGIDAATTTFRDTYNAMPGDLINPNVRIPNCTGTCLLFGNGDTRVNTVASPLVAPGNEETAFWGHLSASDLISGVDANGIAAWGQQFPTAPITGGYHVGFWGGGALGTNAQARAGHYLVLHNNVAAAPGANALDATQAARLDRKLDDGVPNQGTVFTNDGAPGCNAAGVYNEATANATCDLVIRFQN